MNQEEFGKFKNWIVTNEGEAWKEMQALRFSFENNYQKLFSNLEIKTSSEARKKALSVINKVLKKLETLVDLSEVEPGHGLGHLGRDYLHALVLSKSDDISPNHIYVGMIAGVFHDILGCSLLPRYIESKRVVRHAEAGALFFYHLSKDIGIDKEEVILIVYAIAAHTHYLKESNIFCADGFERQTKPYIDIDEKGNPIMGIFLPRWTDRLDVSSSCAVGRHYLTLLEDHEEHSAEGYFNTNYLKYLYPLLRTDEEIKKDANNKTMREFLSMCANTQNNNSPYGRYDFGKMLDLRDYYKKSLLRIIDSFDLNMGFSLEEQDVLLEKWTLWLYEKIEPYPLAKKTAISLKEKFLELPSHIQKPWYNVMKVTLQEYDAWVKKMKVELSDFDDSLLLLPILGDLKETL